MIRAVAQTGLPPKRLMLRVLGSARSHQSMHLPTSLSALAAATRLSPQHLLWQHTAFPYSVAFMPWHQVRQIATKALTTPGEVPVSFGALARSAAQGVARLRFCPECVKDDVKRYGESYWHRLHCLPAVHVCTKHNTPLHVSRTQPRTLSQQLLMVLPQRLLSQYVSDRSDDLDSAVAPECTVDAATLGDSVSAYKLTEQTRCPVAVRGMLAEITATALSPNWLHRDDWSCLYRAKAVAHRYVMPSGAVAGTRLAHALRALFGAGYLEELDCYYEEPSRGWPTTMVRSAPNVAFAPVKHVLLEALFRSGSTDTQLTVYQHRAPGKKPQDYGKLDARLASMVERAAVRFLTRGEVVTVKDLLQRLGAWETFRHERGRLPLTEAQIQAFRRTDASARKVGGRAAHAKRLRAIEQGRQKPPKPWAQREHR